MSLLNTILPSISRNGTTESQTVRPRYSVDETADAYSVRVALPGVAKDGVEVTAEAGEIKITGKRSWTQPQGWTAVYSETSGAAYELVLTHENQVDADRIQAELADGILTVTVPKAETAKARKIQVS